MVAVVAVVAVDFDVVAVAVAAVAVAVALVATVVLDHEDQLGPPEDEHDEAVAVAVVFGIQVAGLADQLGVFVECIRVDMDSPRSTSLVAVDHNEHLVLVELLSI